MKTGPCNTSNRPTQARTTENCRFSIELQCTELSSNALASSFVRLKTVKEPLKMLAAKIWLDEFGLGTPANKRSLHAVNEHFLGAPSPNATTPERVR